MNTQWLSVRVKGDYALFTRIEAKVERVSYSIITPSAARGILEAIYWHPQFRYAIREIWVLAEPKTIGILRNEVKSKMSLKSGPFFADEYRTQRQSLCLREVDYVIFADVEVKAGVDENPAKYRDQFRRRVERGQCYHRPALGCREFAADFEPVEPGLKPVDWSENLGLMLWDIQYPGGKHAEKGWHPSEKPPYVPLFFEAEVTSGVMKVPSSPLGGAR
jgi:CRISPR-associated protein Cas5d